MRPDSGLPGFFIDSSFFFFWLPVLHYFKYFFYITFIFSYENNETNASVVEIIENTEANEKNMNDLWTWHQETIIPTVLIYGVSRISPCTFYLTGYKFPPFYLHFVPGTLLPTGLRLWRVPWRLPREQSPRWLADIPDCVIPAQALCPGMFPLNYLWRLSEQCLRQRKISLVLNWVWSVQMPDPCERLLSPYKAVGF